MRRIPSDVIADVLAANRIEDVVSQYVQLRPEGRNLKALCPFHREKTPSFKVHPDKQIYRCYGCGQAGNAISFIMAVEQLDFVAAVRFLAERSRISLRFEGGGGDRSLNEQAKRANELACEFFRRQLESSAFGEQVREYLESRGIGRELQELFLIGAAPPQWDALGTYLSREGISREAMIHSGLLREGKQPGSCYDYFRSRVMFPILDPRGRVIGFGGRALGEGEPKYLNTPETPFFRKGRILYGIHLAADVMRSSQQAVVVEGYTDVIMAVGSGIEGVVACLGTALTRDNARELKRYARAVVLVYDGDPAGERAAERAVGPLLSYALDVRVALLPSGSDPCDYIRRYGQDAFAAVVEDAVDAVDFLVHRARTSENVETPSGVRRAVDRCLAPLNEVSDPVVRQVVRKRVADAFGVTEGALLRVVPRARVPDRTRPERTLQSLGPEENLVMALVADPAVAGEISLPESFQDQALDTIARQVVSLAAEGFSIPALHARLAGSEAEERFIQLLSAIEDCSALKGLVDWRIIARNSRQELERKTFLREGETVRSQLAEARRRGDQDEERRLLALYQSLLRHAKGGKRSDVSVRKELTEESTGRERKRLWTSD